MGGRRKGKGSYNKSDEVMSNTKNLYPVSDRDISLIKEAMDNSQKTTKTFPDGMGKDATEAIKEFLKKNKE
jgi:hypothetical protein